MIDLRSDTVTRPDAEMRRAMADAEVGDDVLGEDPTVRELEEVSAAAVGMEAALFVPSGTMGNEIALHLLARPGSEVICEATSHVFNYEMAGMAALSGLLARPIPAERGLLTAELVEEAVAPSVSYRAPSGLLSLENSANMAGGTVCTPARQAGIVAAAREHGLPVHLDGARIFNAAVALGLEPADLSVAVDSVMFCLSKGLGAPVGSMLCGSRPFISEARRVRKMFGGGMRQVGVLAAAGLVALRRGPARLAEDHANAVQLAEALARLPGMRILSLPVETNIVVVELSGSDSASESHRQPAEDFVERLAGIGILAIATGARRVRFVTHRDVGTRALMVALDRLEGLARA